MEEKNKNIIEWQTGTPDTNCNCIVTIEIYNKRKIAFEYFDTVFGWRNYKTIIAWCKLSDIELYKE